MTDVPEINQKLTVKEKKAKDQQQVIELHDKYTSSKLRLADLDSKKNEPLNFTGSYDQLQLFFEAKQNEMKEIERAMQNERIYMRDMWYKYSHLNIKVKTHTRLDKMRAEIKEMKKQETAVARENKKISKNFDMNKLNNLPLELVDIIRSFIPYETRNILIESTRPFRLFNNLTTCTLKSFLMNINYMAAYFTLLPTNEQKLKQIFNPNVTSQWKPDWLEYTNRDCIETRIKHIFHKFKKTNPKGAYELMRMFVVLINPYKTYNKHDGRWTRLTSIPV